MKMWRDLVAEAKREISLLQIKDVKEKLDKEEDFILIDVREPDEQLKGRLPKSVPIPRGILEMTMERHFKDQARQIVLYCAGGGRSAVAAQSLKKRGYENVGSMEGGYEGWVQSGLPIEK